MHFTDFYWFADIYDCKICKFTAVNANILTVFRALKCQFKAIKLIESATIGEIGTNQYKLVKVGRKAKVGRKYYKFTNFYLFTLTFLPGFTII